MSHDVLRITDGQHNGRRQAPHKAKMPSIDKRLKARPKVPESMVAIIRLVHSVLPEQTKQLIFSRISCANLRKGNTDTMPCRDSKSEILALCWRCCNKALLTCRKQYPVKKLAICESKKCQQKQMV
jgi:hypothetical protein